MRTFALSLDHDGFLLVYVMACHFTLIIFISIGLFVRWVKEWYARLEDIHAETCIVRRR